MSALFQCLMSHLAETQRHSYHLQDALCPRLTPSTDSLNHLYCMINVGDFCPAKCSDLSSIIIISTLDDNEST